MSEAQQGSTRYELSPDRRHLEPDAEQAALAEIRNLRHQGYSLRGIAATLRQLRAPARAAVPSCGWNRWPGW
jgi:hypothetical protein